MIVEVPVEEEIEPVAQENDEQSIPDNGSLISTGYQTTDQNDDLFIESSNALHRRKNVEIRSYYDEDYIEYFYGKEQKKEAKEEEEEDDENISLLGKTKKYFGKFWQNFKRIISISFLPFLFIISFYLSPFTTIILVFTELFGVIKNLCSFESPKRWSSIIKIIFSMLLFFITGF